MMVVPLRSQDTSDGKGWVIVDEPQSIRIVVTWNR
jgi:hypothetical protein